jgi:DNA invertase Pin-like site-specific DNA recombinase
MMTRKDPAPDLPIGGYCRISEADLLEIRRAVDAGLITAEEGVEMERKGVLKQREDVAQIAEPFGRPVKIYEDNSLSAFKRNVRRPDFEQMVKDLTAGKLAGIVGYDIDRIFRQPRDLEKVIDHYETCGLNLVFKTGSGQNYDLTTGDGRFSARLFVSIANKSSEDASRRIKREVQRKAQKGEYHGGTHPYGWRKDDRDKLDSEATKHIRKIVNGHLAGDKIATCMEYLADQGVVNPNTGKPFTWAGTKTLIYRARSFGIRIYLGEPQTTADGGYVMGDWEPIFTTPEGEPDFDKYEQLVALKAGRSPAGPQEKSSVKYLLSRIVRCGRCGYPMVGKTVWIRGKKSQTFAYNCNKAHPDACGKMGASGPRVDDLIKKLVWSQAVRASQERTLTPEPGAWAREGELKDIDEQITELKELWAAKKIRAASYVVTLDELEAQKMELKADRAVHTATPPIRVITPELLKSGWEGLSVERQRIIVRSVLKAVIIHPARDGKRGGAFDPMRVEPVFA